MTHHVGMFGLALAIIDGLIIGCLPKPLFYIALTIVAIKGLLILEVMQLPCFFLTEEHKMKALLDFERKPKLIKAIILNWKKYQDLKHQCFEKFLTRGKRNEKS